MEDQLIQRFIEENKLPQSFYNVALKWFIPIAEQLHKHKNEAHTPFFVGFNGCQGSGKSTLCAFIEYYLARVYKVNSVTLSLDDFYLSRQQRQALASEVHQLFITRGVPGTHDMASLTSVLHKLKNRELGFAIPRFNKATDNPHPIEAWGFIDKPVELVLIEGWCWGTRPQSPFQLSEPVNSLEEKEDGKGVWRQYSDRVLEQAFLPLYNLMDFWIMLKAPSFDCVFEWRLEQEQRLRAVASKNASGLMTANQLRRFVSHYQRLTEHTLNSHRNFDLVIELAPDRSINQVVSRPISGVK
ncbi:kinase [Psychrosphaera ytuae]|uniref:Kinase n=1 Tax=Psychrosphaera ytuae TaxID=2820710 RepID=A0A975D9W2_9GAMM|nr:kinase [Psychrosphaera ytuae]QTH63227.1 kinase [Psychrosphaera ytuae]